MDNRYYKHQCPQYSMYQQDLTSYVDADIVNHDIVRQNKLKNNSNDLKMFLQKNASTIMMNNFKNLVSKNSCQFKKDDVSGSKLCNYCCTPNN